MLCGSETWCLRENELAILRRTERAMERAMCGAKLMKKKKTEDLMEMLGLKETVVQMAKANGVRWYSRVLRRDDGHGVRSKGQEEARTTKEDVEDASGEGEQERWFGKKGRHESNEMEWELERLLTKWGNPATPIYGDKPGSKLD